MMRLRSFGRAGGPSGLEEARVGRVVDQAHAVGGNAQPLLHIAAGSLGNGNHAARARNPRFKRKRRN
jgi:hypothetical protein